MNFYDDVGDLMNCCDCFGDPVNPCVLTLLTVVMSVAG